MAPQQPLSQMRCSTSAFASTSAAAGADSGLGMRLRRRYAGSLKARRGAVRVHTHHNDLPSFGTENPTLVDELLTPQLLVGYSYCLS